MNRNQYIAIANVFKYPTSEFKSQMAQVQHMINMIYPVNGSLFEKFYSKVNTNNNLNEEHYLKTFEIEGICCMDVGYVLFGEDYKRGDFLAKIKSEQLLAGNDMGIELADHLPNILSLIAVHPDAEFVDELAFGMLITAAKEMLTKFESSDNHYKYAFELLINILEEDFGNVDIEQFKITSKQEACFSDEYSCGADFKKSY